jgi:tetratricopeptide (TPR) repeat protein
MGPYHASCHLNYALLKFQLQQIDAAKALLDKALTLDPTLIEAHYHRGVIAMQQGDNERAMLEMQETLDRNKDHFAANYNLAILYKMHKAYNPITKVLLFYSPRLKNNYLPERPNHLSQNYLIIMHTLMMNIWKKCCIIKFHNNCVNY